MKIIPGLEEYERLGIMDQRTKEKEHRRQEKRIERGRRK